MKIKMSLTQFVPTTFALILSEQWVFKFKMHLSQVSAFQQTFRRPKWWLLS